MRIIGCDLHARQQTLAMLDTTIGEVVNCTLMYEGNQVREFYAQLPPPVLVGIEAIGPMQWFLNLLEELGIELPGRGRHKDSRRGAAQAKSMIVFVFRADRSCRMYPDMESFRQSSEVAVTDEAAHNAGAKSANHEQPAKTG